MIRAVTVAALLLTASAHAVSAQEPSSDLIDRRTIDHRTWGIAFDLPLPNRVCHASPPHGMGRIVDARIGPDAECRAPESRTNVGFTLIPEHYDVALENPYPPIRREIARGECFKDIEPAAATFRQAERIGGLPAFLCRRVVRTRDGAERIAIIYYAFRGYSVRGDPPSPLYPGIQYRFMVSTTPAHEREGVALLDRIVRSVALVRLE